MPYYPPPAQSLLSNFQAVNNGGTVQYWKIATLPASASTTYDDLSILATTSDTLAAADSNNLRLLLGNKTAFSYNAQFQGYVSQNAGIRCYLESGGSVSVYAYLKAGTTSSIIVTVQNAETINSLSGAPVLVYSSPTLTTSPTGTLVYSSGDPTTYPPLYISGTDGTLTGSGNQFYIPGGLTAAIGNVRVRAPVYPWNSVLTAIETSGVAAYSDSAGDGGLAVNAYSNGSSWVYKNNGPAGLYEVQQTYGNHSWGVATSGTAGANVSFNRAMNLFSSTGNLAVGSTIDNGARLHATSGGASVGGFFDGNNTSQQTADLVVSRAGATESGTIGYGPIIELSNSTNNTAVGLQQYSNNFQIFNYSGSTWTERMRLTANGDIGLGTTGSAWGSSYTAVELPAGAFLTDGTNTFLAGNAYQNGTNWIYRTSARATLYGISSVTNEHNWYTAPSGTAGNPITFTQAMTLFDNGNLVVGSTSNTLGARVQITNAGSAIATSGNSGATFTGPDIIVRRSGTEFSTVQNGSNLTLSNSTSGSAVGIQNYAGNMQFFSSTAGSNTEKARLDSLGNFGIGVIPQTWYTGSGIKVVQLSTSAAIRGVDAGSGNRQISFSSNSYADSAGTERYIVSDTSQTYLMVTGRGHAWYSAPSGSAGGAVTYTNIANLFNNGNYAVGYTTDQGYRLQISGTSLLNGQVTLAAQSGSSGQMKWNTGSLLGSPVANTTEWDGTNWYITNSGGTRKQVAYVGSYTSGVLSAGAGSTTSGTSATALYSYTIPANTISAARPVLNIKGIISESGAAAGSVTFTIGGAAISTSFALSGGSVSAATFDITVVWTSSSTALAFATFVLNPSPTTGLTTVSATGSVGINWTTSNALVITGTASAGSASVVGATVIAP